MTDEKDTDFPITHDGKCLLLNKCVFALFASDSILCRRLWNRLAVYMLWCVIKYRASNGDIIV